MSSGLLGDCYQVRNITKLMRVTALTESVWKGDDHTSLWCIGVSKTGCTYQRLAYDCEGERFELLSGLRTINMLLSVGLCRCVCVGKGVVLGGWEVYVFL